PKIPLGVNRPNRHIFAHRGVCTLRRILQPKRSSPHSALNVAALAAISRRWCTLSLALAQAAF
ncbi:hypothetical protein, partial [Gluconobacter cerinus]|uniref:hypothetical protein n=1 Tax=Gluconobacter cerinus TaxID=38307 RepID=UPI001B8B2010